MGATQDESRVGHTGLRDVLALEALLKQAQGKGQPSAAEQKAIEAYTLQVIESQLPSVKITRKLYCKLAGTSLDTVAKHAEKNNLPFGKPVHLRAMITALHKTVGGRESPRQLELDLAGERKQLELDQARKKNMLLEIELREKQGEFLERSSLRSKLETLAGRLRAIGARLGKKFGPEAQNLLNQSLEDIEESFADDDTSD